ncbi:MAG: outer membrane protein assembly factor BamA [Prevotellaceae bacterium]|jgi:outer membrane protein insertion porin family|nr:outer membrane protein assembly factor BamA [Prevotellaceae bacterium]
MKQLYQGKIEKTAGRKNIVRILYFMLALTICDVANAQIQDSILPVEQDYEMPKKYVIEDVTVSGVNFTDKSNIVNISGLTKGTIISVPGDDRFRQAVKRLWAQNSFGSVDIIPVKTEDEKIWLEIVLSERPRIYKWEILGIKKSKAKDIDEILTLRKGSALSDYVIKSNVDKIKKYYAEKGYLNAEVDVQVKNDTLIRNSATLTFTINRKNKVKVKEITFDGNENINDRKLRGALKNTKQRKGFSFRSMFKSKKFIESKYEEDKGNLIDYYNRKGYRDAEILTDSVYRVSENRMNINFKVYEGKRYYFRNITWIGNTKYPTFALADFLNIQKGDVYDPVLLQERLVEDEQSVIVSFYQDNGYIFSRMTPVETNIIGDSIDLEIHVFEGEQARLSQVNISGNTKTNEHVIRRELRTVPGDLFSISKFRESIRMLSSMKYFDAEELGKNASNFIAQHPAEGTVDINYEFTEVSQDQFELSGGWGANMFVGSVGVTFSNFAASRLFDIKSWRPVPTGDGQTLGVRFQTNGKRYQQFSINFMEPWLGGRKPIGFSLSAYYSRQTSVYNPYYDSSYGYGGGYGYGYNYYDYDSNESMQVMGMSVGLSHRLNWPDNLFTLSYNLTLQRYKLRNWTGGFIFSNGNSNNFSLNVAFGRNSTNHAIFPTQGSNFSVGVQFTPPYSLFADKNYKEMKDVDKYKWIEYHKWRMDGTFFAPLVSDKLILMARANFGYLGYYNKKWGYSPFEGFVVGGGGMSGYVMYGQDIIALRGYEDNSLTPYSRNAYNGNVYNKYTVELRYPVIQQPASYIFLLTFLEGGNCWESIDKFNPFDIKRSVGVGVRVYLNIVGTLGLDWGYGLDKIPGRDMKRGQLHFVMGHSF